MLSKIITVVLYLALAFVWVILMILLGIMFLISPLLQHFWNGAFVLVFGFLALLVFMLPLIFRKKLSANWMMPLAMLLLTGIVCLTSYGILNMTREYVSTFNKTIWDHNVELRIYMIESLENNYQLIGKTEQEIKALIGEPANISEYNGRIFEYLISSGYIDPITFNIEFENGVVKSYDKVRH